MKKNDVKELAKLSVESLKEKLGSLRKDQFKAYNARIQGETKNVHAVYQIKKDVARVMTELKKKELGL